MILTLKIYNGGDKPILYRDDRSRKSFVRFAKKFIHAEVVELWDGNVKTELSDLDPDRAGLPWVVSFDNGQGNVPEYNAMLRLGKNTGLLYSIIYTV